MFEALLNPDAWMSLLTLTLLEIVLGIDNVIFLSIISGDLPREQRPLARRIGLGLALILRVLLLFTITWIAESTHTLVTILGNDISWRDIIMLGGGLFLIWKSTNEMHEMLDGDENEAGGGRKPARFSIVIFQIAALDLVFSLDSIITAVGMSGVLPIMIGAVVIAIIIMLLASNAISDFISENPSIKMLALSFIMLVGLMLMADGLDYHIPRGYLYFSITFSLFVEFLNLRAANARKRKLKRPDDL